MNREYINAEVQRLHGEGYSIRQIAAETGIGKSSVGRIVKAMHDNNPGTGGGTHPEVDSGTVSKPAPETGRNTDGTYNGRKDFDKESVSPLQEDTEENFSLSEEFFVSLRKQNLQIRYRVFLNSTEEFLGGNLDSEEVALFLFKSRQSRVEELINYAFNVCYECHVQYNELYMAHVLEQLYGFLGQHPELEKVGYGFKIKNSTSIRILLRGAVRLDVFEIQCKANRLTATY
ncbi:helix-turn-helix domain-containing protein [Rufibacter immobilis]|uniref:helix-turn-helix domain-containing protein n=1 Tax=Rufibacter immobilis TaxID=1348778 RepID=UPI0035F0EF1B